MPGLAAAAIWLPLGLFSQHSRYLIIPATLVAVVFSVAVGRVAEAAGDAPLRFRVAAGVALAGLIVASFSARRDFYDARWSLGRPTEVGDPDPVPRALLRTRRARRHRSGLSGADRLVLLRAFHDPARLRALESPRSLRSRGPWRAVERSRRAGPSRLGNRGAAPGRESVAIHAPPRAGARGIPAFLRVAGRSRRRRRSRAGSRRRSVGRFPGRIEPVEALVLEAR